MTDFLALPGIYRLLFLYLEPLAVIVPAIMIFTFPGASWFYHELVPSIAAAPPAGFLEPRTTMAVWQLGNYYMLIGTVSTFVFRAIRDAVPHDLPVQERLVGALLGCLTFADVIHALSSFIALPADIRYNPATWNLTTHGNVSVTAFLFLVRLSWFFGIGRTRYYFGVDGKSKSK